MQKGSAGCEKKEGKLKWMTEETLNTVKDR